MFAYPTSGTIELFENFRCSSRFLQFDILLSPAFLSNSRGMFHHNVRVSVPNMSALSAPRCLGRLSDKLVGSRVNLIFQNENKFAHVRISMYLVFVIGASKVASNFAIISHSREIIMYVSKELLLLKKSFILSLANVCAIKVSSRS